MYTNKSFFCNISILLLIRYLNDKLQLNNKLLYFQKRQKCKQFESLFKSVFQKRFKSCAQQISKEKILCTLDY